MQQEGVYISSVTGWVLAAVITFIAIPFSVWVVTSISALNTKAELHAFHGKHFDERLDRLEKHMSSHNKKLDRLIWAQWKFFGTKYSENNDDDEEKDE
jgi:hypothetical protein